VATADYSLFVVNAKRIWAHSDARILELFENASKKSISLVLNMLDVDDLEEVVGEIPKKRSKLRLLIKRLLRL
jgi:predicted GTPase